MDVIIKEINKRRFLFEELVKRDFKKKYKRTLLGIAWSLLSPLLQLGVMSLVFSNFFGRNTPHYTIYLFCGTLLFSFFKESTIGGMSSLMNNAKIFSKINIPKHMFLLSKNVSVILNFLLNLVIFFIFVLFDGILLNSKMIMLLYPIICLIILNIGMGLILSALYVFFRDIAYLYDIFVLLLNYLSAIFYTLDQFPSKIQNIFLLNPVYCYIKYFRLIIIENTIPSIEYHLLCIMYALIILFIGLYVYKKYNHKFLYYV